MLLTDLKVKNSEEPNSDSLILVSAENCEVVVAGGGGNFIIIAEYYCYFVIAVKNFIITAIFPESLRDLKLNFPLLNNFFLKYFENFHKLISFFALVFSAKNPRLTLTTFVSI